MSVEVRRIIRVGPRSSAVTIPSRWLRALGLKKGSQVVLVFTGSRILVEPLQRDNGLGGQIAVSGSDKAALAKLKAAFLEGISRIVLKSSYEEAVKLMMALREEIPSVVFIAEPRSTHHTIIFPEVSIEYPALVVKLCELFKKIIRREGDFESLLADFNYTQLLLIRSLKVQAHASSFNVHEALDAVLFARVLQELLDELISSTSLSEELADALSILVEQYCSRDLDEAVRTASSVLEKLSSFPPKLQKHLSLIAELILRKCIRDRACRCKHFYPQV